jgi:hypothetical protein
MVNWIQLKEFFRAHLWRKIANVSNRAGAATIYCLSELIEQVLQLIRTTYCLSESFCWNGYNLKALGLHMYSHFLHLSRTENINYHISYCDEIMQPKNLKLGCQQWIHAIKLADLKLDTQKECQYARQKDIAICEVVLLGTCKFHLTWPRHIHIHALIMLKI